jgi:hypothetical protein
MINYLLLKCSLELIAIFHRYHPTPPDYLLIRSYLQLIPNLQLHHTVILYPPHKHLLQFYTINHNQLVLTHELDADDDAAAGIFGGESRSGDEPLACLVAVVAENTDAVHARLDILSQHPVGGLFVQGAEDFSVPLVDLKVFWVKL